MSKTILQTTIMISQIYEKYMCYLNTNQECQAFTNYYDLREKIVSGWIHENADEFAEIWEIVKYNEIHEFSSSIYMRHPNCNNPELVGPYEIPNYVGCVLPTTNLPSVQPHEDLDYFKPSRSSAQPYRAFELSRSTAEPYDGTIKFHFDYNILKGGGSSVRETNQTNMTLSELDVDNEDEEMPELMEM